MSAASSAENHFKKALAEAEKNDDVVMVEMLKGLKELARAVKFLPTQ